MRNIELDDIPTIINLLLHLRDESPVYAEVFPDIDYVSGTLHNMIQLDGFIGLIAGDHGVMFGMVSTQWYTARVNAYEQLLYILPEKRGTSLAVRLIRGMEDLAHRRGAHSLYVGTSTGMQEERTRSLYEHLGYERFGGGLRKELH